MAMKLRNFCGIALDLHFTLVSKRTNVVQNLWHNICSVAQCWCSAIILNAKKNQPCIVRWPIGMCNEATAGITTYLYARLLIDFESFELKNVIIVLVICISLSMWTVLGIFLSLLIFNQRYYITPGIYTSVHKCRGDYLTRLLSLKNIELKNHFQCQCLYF